MTMRPPPKEPIDDARLDADERELARIAQALPSGEPSPMLDARILKAASNAVAPSAKNRLAWLTSAGSAWSIGSAAAAVLAIGIGWQVLRPMPRSLPAQAQAPAPVDEAQNEQAGVPVEFKQEELDGQASRAYSSPEASSKSTDGETIDYRNQAENADAPVLPLPASTAKPAPVASPPPFPFPDEPLAESSKDFGRAESISESAKSQGTLAPIAADAAADVAAEPERQMSSGARLSRQEVPLGAVGTASKAVAAPAPVISAETLENRARENTPLPQSSSGADATSKLDLGKPDFGAHASDWLREIRHLRDQGNYDEAQTALREFVARFPHHAIPSDLAPLLQE
jgi:hypothetical protein